MFTIFFVLSLLVFSPVSAQRTRGMNADGDVLGGSSSSSGGYSHGDGWLGALNIGYETPLGSVKEVYKSAPTFGFTVMRKMNQVIYSGTVDYRSYKPREDALSNSGGTDGFSSSASNFRSIGLYLGVSYELPVTGTVSVYGGVNGGFMLSSYKITVDDADYTYIEEVSNVKSTYIGPKIGFNFSVSKNVSIGLEGRYSLGVVGANYNTRDGGSVSPGFNSYAGNVFLIYGF